jgi:hypothetical protein
MGVLIRCTLPRMPNTNNDYIAFVPVSMLNHPNIRQLITGGTLAVGTTARRSGGGARGLSRGTAGKVSAQVGKTAQRSRRRRARRQPSTVTG